MPSSDKYLVFDSPTFMDSRDEHISNTSFPIWVTLSGMVIEVSDVHP